MGQTEPTVFVDRSLPLRVAADFDAIDGGERDIGVVFAVLVLDEDEGLVVGLRVIHRRLKGTEGEPRSRSLTTTPTPTAESSRSLRRVGRSRGRRRGSSSCRTPRSGFGRPIAPSRPSCHSGSPGLVVRCAKRPTLVQRHVEVLLGHVLKTGSQILVTHQMGGISV